MADLRTWVASREPVEPDWTLAGIDHPGFCGDPASWICAPMVAALGAPGPSAAYEHGLVEADHRLGPAGTSPGDAHEVQTGPQQMVPMPMVARPVARAGRGLRE